MPWLFSFIHLLNWLFFPFCLRLSRLFVDAQTVLSYSGNRSFSGFQEMMKSVQRLAERPGAWPSTVFGSPYWLTRSLSCTLTHSSFTLAAILFTLCMSNSERISSHHTQLVRLIGSFLLYSDKRIKSKAHSEIIIIIWWSEKSYLHSSAALSDWQCT